MGEAVGGRGFTLLGNGSGTRLLPGVSRQGTFLKPFLKVVTKGRVGITYAGKCSFFLISCGCRGMHSSSGARLNQTHRLRTLVVHCAGKGGFSKTSADGLAVNFHGQGERLAGQHSCLCLSPLLTPLHSYHLLVWILLMEYALVSVYIVGSLEKSTSASKGCPGNQEQKRVVVELITVQWIVCDANCLNEQGRQGLE